jgi:hypothetical protein
MDETVEIEGGKFLIRPYRAQDEAGVLQLWRLAFDKELPERIWRWKFIDGPFGHRIMICVDRQENVLAMFSGIPYPANREGRVVEITQLIDNVSHPDYRRTGLFVRTIDHFIHHFNGPDRCVFLYGFPGMNHFSIGEKYQQYRRLAGGFTFLSARAAEIAGPSRPGGIRLVPVADESFDRIWERCRPEYPFAVVRDSRFMRWRFDQNPVHRYQTWRYESDPAGVEGHATFLVQGEKAVLVDLLMPNAPPCIREFLGLAAAELSGQGVDRIEGWLPAPHFTTRGLIEAGFTGGPEPLGIVPTGRSFDPSLPFDWASANIYYTMADGDLF